MDKNEIKKVLKTFSNIIMYVFLTLCIFTVFITISARRATDGAAEIFGYQMRIVLSDSMEKCENTDVSDYDIKHIPVRSMVFVKSIPSDKSKHDAWYEDIEPGDVLTFRYVYTTQETITHRVISCDKNDDGEGYTIVLKGDNTNSADADRGALEQTIDTSVPNNMNYVLGKVTGQSYLLGLIISFLMTPLGMVLVIMVPCFIIILLEVLKIIKMFNESKINIHIDVAQTERELAELREKLAMFEAQQAAANSAPKTEAEPEVETEPVAESTDTIDSAEEEVQ
jgi:signal peptidase I